MANFNVQQFEEAFSMHVSGLVAECNCGKVYWDAYNSGYTLETGERERLESGDAISVPHGIERVLIEGTVYCMDCDCWHQRAARISQWLTDNRREVGEWYRLEGRRLQHLASEMPIVESEATP